MSEMNRACERSSRGNETNAASLLLFSIHTSYTRVWSGSCDHTIYPHLQRGAPLLTQYLTPSHLVRAYQSVHLSRVSSFSEPETSVLTTDSRRALIPTPHTLFLHCEILTCIAATLSIAGQSTQ